jgi:hypothetical protein
MRNAAQQWFKFHNVGQSPYRRSCHAMASDGTHVFVLGGNSLYAQVDDISFIHVFDTSMYVRLVNLSEQRSKLRTQRISSTRNPSVTLSIPMRRPHNFRRSHPRVPRPRSNHSTRHPLHPMPTVLPVCKRLAPPYRAALPPCRSLMSKTRVRMIGNWSRRLYVTQKTASAKVQRSTMRSSQILILLLKEKLQGWSLDGSCRYHLLRKLSWTTVLHG